MSNIEVRVKVKVKADLERILGKELAKNLIVAVRGAGNNKQIQRLPYVVYFHDVKPRLTLGDNDLMDAYGADLATGQITGSVYCGCGDTPNDAHLRHAEGQTVPDGKVMLFVRRFWNGRNTSWFVDVVSSNLTKQITKG